MYWFGDIGGSGYTLMIISTAAFWGLVITGFVLLSRSDGPGEKPTPEQMLGQRFARGEVDAAEDNDRLARRGAVMTTPMTDHVPARATRRTVNISTTERVRRVLVGLVGVAVGALLLIPAGSVPAVVLVLAGFELVVTGATGHCPLYQKLSGTRRCP